MTTSKRFDCFEMPSQPSLDWRKGFLAGIFDAEGSYGRSGSCG